LGDNLPNVDLGRDQVAIDIATGRRFTCALLKNRQIKCWGQNSSGQLGLGHTEDIGDQPGEMGDHLPFVDLGEGQLASSIYSGAQENMCAKLINNTIKCWGRNSDGQLGLEDIHNRGDEPNEMGDNLPPVYFGKNLVASDFALGADHACVILMRSSQQLGLKCWGDNGFGRLGLGDSDNRGDKPGDMVNLDFVDLGNLRLKLLPF
jgi:alpha-tubulin suppressor-like RCC1 family protein